jgi:hypothetical protein
VTTATPPGTPPDPDRSAPFVRTPNAERYLLEADSLRRRQLHSALLHGSRRTWRDRRRIWPAVVAGLVVVAVIAAAIAVYGTFRQQQREREEADRQGQALAVADLGPGAEQDRGPDLGPEPEQKPEPGPEREPDLGPEPGPEVGPGWDQNPAAAPGSGSVRRPVIRAGDWSP